MPYVLGITSSLSQNAAAVLLKDGKIVAAAEEERFTRIKHACDVLYPKNAVNYCLSYADIKLNDLDSVNLSWASASDILKKHISLFTRKPSPILIPNLIYSLKAIKQVKDLIKGVKINYCEHHLSHLASAYYCSGFKESNVLSIDAVGEVDSTCLAIGKEKKIGMIKKYDFFNSLGILYHNFTGYLNFMPQWHEGKVMGLSSYGKAKYDLSFIIDINKSSYRINNPINNNFGYLKLLKMAFRRGRLESYIKDNLNIPRGYALSKKGISTITYPFGNLLNEKLGCNNKKEMYDFVQKEADVAASIQKTYENALISVATRLHEESGITSYALAGGCALNCLANYALLKSDFVNDIFIQPAANDAGSALGAALLESAKYAKVNYKMEHAYFGPEYNDEEIKKTLEMHKLSYSYHKDIAGTAAELLSKGKVIAWFQGRMEFGPRALGNRSILSTPCGKETKDKVNKIKRRELWRPFGPSILAEESKKWLVGGKDSPFMTLCFDVLEDKREEVPAIVHIDGTTRPQTVSKKNNLLYYRLIKEFNKSTGIPMLLNTSFNDKTEPIVCSPKDAIRNFNRMELDYLAIGNYLVKK